MHILQFKFKTDLNGFIKTLKFFEELDDPNVQVNHSKRDSMIHKICEKPSHEYEIEVSACGLFDRNVYELLRSLERLLNYMA